MIAWSGSVVEESWIEDWANQKGYGATKHICHPGKNNLKYPIQL